MKNNLAVLILNWNNAKDTIECLNSLEKQTNKNFITFIIDNGSTDNSIIEIENWMENNYEKKKQGYFSYNRTYEECLEINFDTKGLHKKEIVLIKNIENMGFAKGNNVGIKHILNNKNFKHVFLLNNDTALDKDCMKNLMQNIRENPQINIATTKICYFDNPKIIWNCGGQINFLGRRNYFFANNNEENCPKENFEVGLITGCALLINTNILENYGMLTEKFFFGEEDWDFSLRMKEHGKKMYCIPNATVYHKVSASTEAFFDKGELFKICVNYINRFINFKSRYNKIYWFIWRKFYFIYIAYLLKRKGINNRKVNKAINVIKKYSNKNDSVTKYDIKNIKNELSNQI